jgi:mannose-6-phosphate isomerase-like protein (cupin superfamily)
MEMKITDPSLVTDPLVTPSGEIIAEMVGKAVGDDSNHSLARIIIPPGNSSTLHYHKTSQETYFVLKGEGKMQVNDKHFSLLPGQACWIETGEIHRIQNEGDMELVFLAICAPAWVPEDSFDVT